MKNLKQLLELIQRLQREHAAARAELDQAQAQIDAARELLDTIAKGGQ